MKLLNGSLDYTTSGVDTTKIAVAQINAAKIPDNGTVNITVQVTASAKVGTLNFAASGIGTTPTTIEVAGNVGTEQLSFAASATTAPSPSRSTSSRHSTGVSAAVAGQRTA